MTLIDNTWATPLYFKPPRLGIDIGIYAATKYIGGHSDMMMGIVTCPAGLHHPIAKMAHGTLGHAVSADDCYQALRGLRTLHARLTQHQETALVLARWLAGAAGGGAGAAPRLPRNAGPRVLEARFHRLVRPVRRGAEAVPAGPGRRHAGRHAAVRHGLSAGAAMKA